MLYEILHSIKNFFDRDKYGNFFGRHDGIWTIQDGKLDIDFIKPNQYFRIYGSVFNDGVYKFTGDLYFDNDETFEGVIFELRIPADFLKLVEEIESFQAKYGEASPYISESFGGYTYNKGTREVSWRESFGNRLRTWRKI